MKWLLITLAIGLASSDKLDRTYLPPPGAQFAGGLLGHHDAPLAPPHHIHPTPGTIVGGQRGSQPDIGINGETANFGDKIPKGPKTTTSIAFSQTTYPDEGYETTALPINPVTGHPINVGPSNYPYGPPQGQLNNLPPNYGTNIQPGFTSQGSTTTPSSYSTPGYEQSTNQPIVQYPGQTVVTPGSVTQIPGSVYPGQNQGQSQYPGVQVKTEQPGILPIGVSNNQLSSQYPGQNAVNPGGVIQIPGSNDGLVQYPGTNVINPGGFVQIPAGNQGSVQYPGQDVANPVGVIQTPNGNQGQYLGQINQQGITPTTESSVSLQPGGSQNGIIYDGSQGPISQGTYTGQPINVQNQQPFNTAGIPSQYANENQNIGVSVPTVSGNLYQPGSTPSTTSSSYYNGPSTTPLPGIPSSTSAYSSVRPIHRPERPQAAADRNAVILNYENVRTPNGYSYSFDTSNGIHADESGIVDNGTKAQGSYSYIGDDGKVYSVIYTADENGFQPRGDHLPTPPPIPEAIKEVIEQAARDKAAGIFDDGSYNEDKYGDKIFQGTGNNRRPQNQSINKSINKQLHGAQDDLIKPIAGIKDAEYDEEITQDDLKDNPLVTDIRKSSKEKSPPRYPSNQINNENNSQNFAEAKTVSEDSPVTGVDEYGIPIVRGKINRPNNYGTRKQFGQRPSSNENDLPFEDVTNINQQILPGSINRGPSDRRPISSDVKDTLKTTYPGSPVDIGDDNYHEIDIDRSDINTDQENQFGGPNTSYESGEDNNDNFDRVTGAPFVGNRKQMRQRVKGNRRPDTGNKYLKSKNNKPQSGTFTQENTDYEANSADQPVSNQQLADQNNAGYNYQQPNTKSEQNTFPTRFSSQDISPTLKPDQRSSEHTKEKIRRPFITPNVRVNQNNRKSQTTPNTYNEINRNDELSTRRPFMTIGVTSPTHNTYTDYDDGEDYEVTQDTDDDRFDSTRNPAETDLTSRPYQSTTHRPQYVPNSQRTRVNPKGTVSLGHKSELTGTDSPRYGPTTSMPSQNSRFGSTESSQRTKPQQRRPSNTAVDRTTAVGSPVTAQPSRTRPTNYKYSTKGPISQYTDSNVGSGYPVSSSFPDVGFTSTTQKITTPQSHHNSQDENFHTGYHYGPPKNSGSFNHDRPGTSLFPSTDISGVYPNSPTGSYKITYQPGRDSFPSTTSVPVPEGQGTFIPSQYGSTVPGSSPFGTNQGTFGPSTSDYSTTILSSTPGSKPVYGYTGIPDSQGNTGYEYGPTRPSYTTTGPPSTIGMTPSSYVQPGSGPSQVYSTTYRPGSQTGKDTFGVSPVVDGYGRPITSQQGGSLPTQGLTGPGSTVGPNYGIDQSTTYPGGYDQSKFIGEDFSGPKQPQRFDPKTGYHY